MENVLVEIGLRHLFQSELVYYLFSRVRRLLEKGESKEQESPLPPMSKRGRSKPCDHPSRAGITHMVRLGGDEMVPVGDRVGQSPVHVWGVGREPSKNNESLLGPQDPGVPLWLLVIPGS